MFQESQPKADSFLFFGNMGFLFGEAEANNGNNEEDALQLFQNNLFPFQTLNNVSSDPINNGFTITQKDILYDDLEKLVQEKEICQGQTDPIIKQENGKCLETTMNGRGEESKKKQNDECALKSKDLNKLDNQIKIESKAKTINQRENAIKTTCNAKAAALPEFAQSQSSQIQNIFQIQKIEKNKVSEAKQIHAEIALKKPANFLNPPKQVLKPQMMTKPLFVLKPMKLEKIDEEQRDDQPKEKERSPGKKINKMQLRSSMNFGKNSAMNLENKLLTNLKEENNQKQQKTIILTKSKQNKDENNECPIINDISKTIVTQKESVLKDNGVFKKHKINDFLMRKEQPTHLLFKTSEHENSEIDAKKSVFPKFSNLEKQIFDARPKITDFERKNTEKMGDIVPNKFTVKNSDFFDKMINLTNLEKKKNFQKEKAADYNSTILGLKNEEKQEDYEKPDVMDPEGAKLIENLAEENSKKEENVHFIPMMNSIFFEHQSNLIF